MIAMSMAIYGLCLALLLGGVWRRRNRHGRFKVIFLVLGAAMGTAIGLGAVMPRAQLVPMLSILDAAVVLAMLALWAHYHSGRARWIGVIGLVKCGWALWQQGMPAPHWNGYTAVINGGFILQLIVAGGWADGLAARADRLLRQLRARLAGELGNVA